MGRHHADPDLRARLDWFPVQGFGDGFRGHVHSTFLPSLTLAISVSPVLMRSLRSSMLDVLGSEHVTTARALGWSGWPLYRDHVIRNAIPPVVTLMALQVGYLLFGTVLVERIFLLPGSARRSSMPSSLGDFAVVQGITLVFALIVVVSQLIADLVHGSSTRGSADDLIDAVGIPPELDAAPGDTTRWSTSVKVGLGILIAFVVVAVAAPLIAPYDPGSTDVLNKLQSPSWEHLVGTDGLGRDVFSRLVFASRLDLGIAFASATTGADRDRARRIRRLRSDMGRRRGDAGCRCHPGLSGLCVVDRPVVRARRWPAVVRRRLRDRGVGTLRPPAAVKSCARATASTWRRRSPVGSGGAAPSPATCSPTPSNSRSSTTPSTSSVPWSRFSAIAYLGLGIPPDTVEWGLMIADGQLYLRNQWWLAVAPGVVIAALGFGMTLMADGLDTRWRNR
ncbi:MAG: ABC transporter permease subunit [Ilumatobacteraceae bacterium]